MVFDRKKYHLEWQRVNKDKVTKYRNRYLEKYPEKEKIRHKIYNKANKEKIKKYGKIYREINKFKIKEKDKNYNEVNKDKLNKKVQRFRNTTKYIVYRLKRREIQRGYEPKNITIELIEIVNKRDDKCVYCGNEFIDKKDINYDHIDAFKPLQEDNIVRCCIKCNTSKGTSEVLKWAKSMGYKLPIFVEEYAKKHLREWSSEFLN